MQQTYMEGFRMTEGRRKAAAAGIVLFFAVLLLFLISPGAYAADMVCTDCHTSQHSGTPCPNCTTCHATIAGGTNHHSGVCTSCHTTIHPSPPVPGPCESCHSDKSMEGVNHSKATAYVPQACIDCHTEPGVTVTIQNACYQCHGGSGGPAAPNVPWLNDTRLENLVNWVSPGGMHRAGPDLFISTLTVPVPYTATSGGTVPVTIETKNMGYADAGASTTRLYISTSCTGTLIEIGSRSVGLLAAGATDSATVTAMVPIGTANGTYYVIADADGAGVLPELREDNNTKCAATTPITVAAGDLDLVINSVSSPLYAKKGTNLTVSDVTKNRLAGSTTTTFLTTVYVASTCSVDSTGNPIGTVYSQNSRSIAGIAGSGSSSGSISVTMPGSAGPACLIWRADSGGGVSESAENNNTKTKTITITN